MSRRRMAFSELNQVLLAVHWVAAVLITTLECHGSIIEVLIVASLVELGFLIQPFTLMFLYIPLCVASFILGYLGFKKRRLLFILISHASVLSLWVLLVLANRYGYSLVSG